MVHFKDITQHTFLKDYWQKKPLVIRQALPGFANPLTADELAGLSLEEDIESRIVSETVEKQPRWHLKRGPFNEKDFQKLSKTHWTLLVQGVDRLIPEVHELLEHFNFIPSWRVDDVMISYAALHGSVGPHYDNYDVFLYQAEGRRKWSLTTQKCTPENALSGVELRIMEEFHIEEEFVLEEGDMLYLPPHVGHYGVSLSEECMTYSFGYRSYKGQELLESLGDYASENQIFNTLYQDPDWNESNNTVEIPPAAWKNAQHLLVKLINQDELIKDWFGCFATRLDEEAENQLPLPLEDDERLPIHEFLQLIEEHHILLKDAGCRFAYQKSGVGDSLRLYINGRPWDTEGMTSEFIIYIANHRVIQHDRIAAALENKANQQFLYDLWTLQWLNEDTGDE